MIAALREWWQSHRRQESRLPPGIRAEVTIIMGDNGVVGVFPSKLPPDEDAAEIYRAMTVNWLGFLQQRGIGP